MQMSKMRRNKSKLRACGRLKKSLKEKVQSSLQFLMDDKLICGCVLAADAMN
jgi:hypothetical protein